MNKQKVVLCDIDGTVADISHRVKIVDASIEPGTPVYIKGRPHTKSKKGIVTAIQDKFVYTTIQTAAVRIEELTKVKYWKAFFEACPNDAPLVKNIQVVKALSSVYPVVFMSGRPIDYEKQTREWLRKYSLGGMYYMPDAFEDARTELFMRPSKDTREDYLVKEELYRKYIEPYYDVLVALDDRTQMVQLWRKLGINTFQVADGNF